MKCIIVFALGLAAVASAVFVAEPATDDEIDVKLLARAWTHSFEEDDDGDERIFRPSDSKEFPPAASFRKRYVFNKDGTCEFLYLHPSDAHRMIPGKWKISKKYPRVIKITGKFEGKKLTETLKVVELTDEILRVS